MFRNGFQNLGCLFDRQMGLALEQSRRMCKRNLERADGFGCGAHRARSVRFFTPRVCAEMLTCVRLAPCVVHAPHSLWVHAGRRITRSPAFPDHSSTARLEEQQRESVESAGVGLARTPQRRLTTGVHRGKAAPHRRRMSCLLYALLQQVVQRQHASRVWGGRLEWLSIGTGVV